MINQHTFYAIIYRNLMYLRKQFQSFSYDHSYYYEKHHIIPKSLGGSNKKENLVLLTPKEHFIAHWLLMKMARNTNEKIKMKRAFFFSAYSNYSQDKRLSPKQYQIIKSILNGIQIGSETRKKMSESAKKREKRILTEEHKKKIGEANKISQLGKKASEETKQKMSETGKKYKWKEETYEKMIGQKRTEETKLLMSQSQKGKIRSEETKQKMSEIHKNEQKYECGFCGEYFNGSHLHIHHLSNCKLNPEHIFTKCNMKRNYNKMN